MKINVHELKLVIAEVLEEAKKKKMKAMDAHVGKGPVGAYGNYSEAFDFSYPLGAYNLYRNQGASNFGPYTSAGTRVNDNFHDPNIVPLRIPNINLHEGEEAVRQLVREVIEFGLVPPDSAWAPMMEPQREMMFESYWDAAQYIAEDHWYTQIGDLHGEPEGGPKKKTRLDRKVAKTQYGKVVPHGVPEKGGANKKAW